MTDLHDVLDRKARQFRPGDDGYEQMVDRAERRHRNRRITSGVVALAVAVAGSLGAYAMLIGSASEETAGGEFAALWPQQNRSDADVAQARANEGDGRLTWQQDAEEFLWRFLNDGMSWVDTTIPELSEAQKDGTGPITVTLRGGPADLCTYPDDADEWTCPPDAFKEIDVTIERLLQKDTQGIWFVVGAVVNGSTPRIENSPLPPVDTPMMGPDLPRAEGDFVWDFLTARSEGSGAGAFLSPGALEQYQSHDGGLELYGGYVESSFGNSLLRWEQVEVGWLVTISFDSEAGATTESVVIRSADEGGLLIIGAELHD